MGTIMPDVGMTVQRPCFWRHCWKHASDDPAAALYRERFTDTGATATARDVESATVEGPAEVPRAQGKHPHAPAFANCKWIREDEGLAAFLLVVKHGYGP
jgi:hypothetical protein